MWYFASFLIVRIKAVKIYLHVKSQNLRPAKYMYKRLRIQQEVHCGVCLCFKETEMLLEENKQLREARTCRVCMDLEVNVVFLPCGHLVCCDNCAPALRNCAVCRSIIRGTVKVFLT